MSILDKNDEPQLRPQFLLGVSALQERWALMTLKRGYDVAQSRREMSAVSDNMADRNKWRFFDFLKIYSRLWRPMNIRTFIYITLRFYTFKTGNLVANVHWSQLMLSFFFQINDPSNLDIQITKYFILAERNNQLKNSLPGEVYEIHSAELIKQPRKTLLGICQFLHLTCERRYIEDCSKIIFPEAKKTRHTVVWTDKQKDLVREKLQRVPFLQNYRFEDWNDLCEVGKTDFWRESITCIILRFKPILIECRFAGTFTFF